MNNEILFLCHVVWVSGLAFACRKRSSEVQTLLMVLYGVLGNVMVLKQMVLFGLEVTTADVYAVGVILILNYIREAYDDHAVHKAMLLSFTALTILALSAWFQIAYTGLEGDSLNQAYDHIMSPFPRIVVVSAVVYLAVQYLDNILFSWMKRKCGAQYLIPRIVLSLVLSQWLDTILFTFGALHGIASSIWHIVLFSGLIKTICSLLVVANAAIGHKFLEDRHV